MLLNVQRGALEVSCGNLTDRFFFQFRLNFKPIMTLRLVVTLKRQI